MNAIQKLAAALKARKGIDTKTGRNDPPAPAPPGGKTPPPRRSGRPRYSIGHHERLRLEAQWREANRRAAKAETALVAIRDELLTTTEISRKRMDLLKAELRAAEARADDAETALAAVERVKAVNGEVWRLNQHIARLKAVVAEGRKHRNVTGTAEAAHLRQRVEDLQTEVKELRVKTLVELSQQLGITKEVIRERFRDGWSIERTLGTPFFSRDRTTQGETAT